MMKGISSWKVVQEFEEWQTVQSWA